MQKTKKQLLGLAGLAAVGAMTAVAIAMPSQVSAYTEGVTDKGSGSGDVNLNVTVRNGLNQVIVKTPANNSATAKSIVPVVYTYEESANVVAKLIYTDETGKEVQVEVDNFTPTDIAGTHSFDIDLTKYGLQNREYKLQITATDERGGTKVDTVTFSYNAVVVDPEEPSKPGEPLKPGESANGDPIINIEVSDEVDKVYVHVYDKNGKPVLVDKDGNEVVIVVDAKDVDPETGELKVKLPFEQYGVEDGEYKLVVIGKDKNGNDVSVVEAELDYAFREPEAPDTPNTGSLLDELNITRVDYIVTGVIVFGLVAGAALYLVGRKSRR